MNFVKRRGSSVAKLSVSNFEELKEQYLLDIKAVMEIPPALVFNWNQHRTWIKLTMDKKGSKHVEMVSGLDKRQITAVVCGTMTMAKFCPFS